MSRRLFSRFTACFCLTLGLAGALPRSSSAQVTALQPFKAFGETIGVAVDGNAPAGASSTVVANQKHGPLFTRGIYTIPWVWTPDPDADAQTATPLALLSPNRSTNATAISTQVNGTLVVVGYGLTGTPTVIHACMWTGTANDDGTFSFGSPVDLGTLGGQFSYAYGVNNTGAIVGSSSTGSAYRAYVRIPGIGMTALPLINPSTLGQRYGQSRANAINNAGIIVGWSSGRNAAGRSFSQHACSWAFLNGAWTANDLQTAVTTAGFTDGNVVGINNPGGNNLLCVGEIINPSTRAQHACVWTLNPADGSATGFVDLQDTTMSGTVNSKAYGVNAEGNIVGNYVVASGSSYVRKGFVEFLEAGSYNFLDLTNATGSPNLLTTAVAINDNATPGNNMLGEIVGLDRIGNGDAAYGIP